MDSKFRISMELIPRQRSLSCWSLKTGSIMTAVLLILYSVLSFAHCTTVLLTWGPMRWQDPRTVFTVATLVVNLVIHIITLALTNLMLVGALKENPGKIRPWVVWTSVQVSVYFLLFVFWTIMNVASHVNDSSPVVYSIEFFTLLIRFYMLILVTSFYKCLEEERADREKLETLVHNETCCDNA